MNLCAICASYFHITTSNCIFDERVEWRRFKRKRPKNALVVKAEVIESLYLHREPKLWQSFNRAIIVPPNGNQSHLSGISQYVICNRPHCCSVRNYGRIHSVPEETQKARIGLKERSSSESFIDVDIAQMPFDRDQDSSLEGRKLGYPVHAHCWVLLDHVIGRSLVERNLDRFMGVIKTFWKQNRELFQGCWRPALLQDLGSHVFQDVSTTVFLYTDTSPLNIPEIRDLLRATTEVQSSRKHAHTQDMQPTIGSNVPTDVAFLIVDCIYEAESLGKERFAYLRNMLSAFCWSLPDKYWQDRIDKDLFFELNDLVKGGQNVNWQSLCLKSGELLEDKHFIRFSGIRNRSRILQLLRLMKAAFLSALEEDKNDTEGTE